MNEPIKTYSPSEIASLLESMGQPKFRANQLLDWLYAKNALSYDEMLNLPVALRQKLAEEHPLYAPQLIDRQVSKDGTEKYVLGLQDGARVETVAMPTWEKGAGKAADTITAAKTDKTAKTGKAAKPDKTAGKNSEVEFDETDTNDVKRLTVCFSTQVGCPMACAFCATGHEGLTRNLSVGEMTDQIAFSSQTIGARVSNVVAMGQGEPFLNYDNVLAALRILNSDKFFNIGARHITVSTCGLIDGIRKFSQEPEQFTLAVSLHAARQQVRDVLMPRMENQPLRDLKRAIVDYLYATNRRVTFEYLMIDGVNDSPEDLKALLGFCEGLLCHVNLLPMNRVDSSPFEPSSAATVAKWVSELENRHIEATVRNSRGSDIAGACGQLKNALAKPLS